MSKSKVCVLLLILHFDGFYGIPTSKIGTTSNFKQLGGKNEDKFVIDDDTDMMMEPDEHNPDVRTIYSTGSSSPSGSRSFSPEYTPLLRREFGENVRLPRISQDDEIERNPGSSTAEQNFYPSFFRNAPPLGHSRPYYQPTESFTSDRFNSLPSRSNAGRSNFDQSILGSGDFGVIRGGTFYQDNDPPIKSYDSDYYYNYKSNNGHGRPHTAPLIQKLNYPEDQFANFRDFADINTPTDPAYSQFVVVYANKNATRPTTDEKTNPKNIIEQLELLDKEKEKEEQKKKFSKSKLKLAKSKIAEKKLVKTRNEKSLNSKSKPEHVDDLDDFMLALS